MENSNKSGPNNWDAESVSKYTDVEHIKKRIRRGHSDYIGRHPELRAIIRVLLGEMIKNQPKNIYEFSAALFNCNNCLLLVQLINKHLEWLKRSMRENHWSQYDGDAFICSSDMASTHSLLSKDSVTADIENILRYAMVLRDGK